MATGAPTTAMGQYYLSEKIAQGGMAEIYKGYAIDLHGMRKTVVIKKILPHAAQNREFIDMLVAEAKIAVLLSHGNIAQIYDLGKSHDNYFIVMEYVDGWSVSQIQREYASRSTTIPVPVVCYIVAEALAGLDYMHTRMDDRGQPLGIVHRDVSPQNIMLTRSGTVKIIDFGIAKARTKLDTTEVGILKGKFAYMSPEHARGENIDSRSDLFSLGVILHEMLVGQRLFKAKDHRQTLRNVRRADVSPPSCANPAVPAALDQIVVRLLARDRNDRYQRASSARADLQRLLYEAYPDFRVEQVVNFLADCWKDRTPPAAIDAEGKTPLLIMDHTQSAIAVRVSDATDVLINSTGLLTPFFSTPEEAIPPLESLAALPAGDSPDEPSVTRVQPDWWLWCVAQRDRGLRWLGKGWQRFAVIAHRPVGWRSVLGGVALLLALFGGWTWSQHIWSVTDVWRRMVPIRPPAAELIQRTIPDLPTATVMVNSVPAGARIYVDDSDTGLQTPAVVTVPAEQPVQIGLYLVGYRFFRQAVTPQLEQPVEISVRLDLER